MPVNLNDFLKQRNVPLAKTIKRPSKQGTVPTLPTPQADLGQPGSLGSGKLFSGGAVQDIFDILSIPQFAAVGAFTPEVSVKQAVQQRVAPSDILRSRGKLGPGFGGVAKGFAADVLLDPLNLALGAGLFGKGLQIPGKISKAGKAAKLADVGADIVRFAPKLEPLGLLRKPIKGAVGPVLRPLLETAEKALSKGDEVGAAVTSIKPRGLRELAGDVLRKSPFGRFIQTTPEGFKEANVARRGQAAIGTVGAKETAEQLTKGFSKAQRSVVNSALEGSADLIDWEGVARTHGNLAAENMEKAAGLARRNIDSLSTEFAQELRFAADGIEEISPERANKIRNLASTIEGNVGSYLPVQYADFLENPDSVGRILAGDSKTIDKTFLSKNLDIPDEVRAAWTAIKDPGFRAGVAIKSLTSNIANSRFLRYVADNFATASKTAENSVQMGQDLKFGNLAGKWVTPTVANEMKRILRIKPEGALGALQKGYGKFLNLWKKGKVLWNPATQTRNTMSNAILLDMAQYPVFSKEGVETLIKAAGEVKNKGSIYREAIALGLLEGTFTKAELLNYADDFIDVAAKSGDNAFSAFKNAAKSLAKKPEQLFQANEELSKMALFIYRKNQGDDVAKAAAYAQKWLFDYSDVPEVVRFLRSVPFGYPFLTFSYKSIPRFAETALKRPGAITKYNKAFRNIEADNREKEEALLPQYIKDGTYLRLPWEQEIKMQDGTTLSQPVYLNLNYILPWGDISEVGKGKFLPGQDPVGVITGAIRSNKHPFFDTPIWKETDTPEEKSMAVTNFVYQTLVPSFAPGSVSREGLQGGYSWNKLVSALTRRPDYKGRLRNLPVTLLDVLGGIKLTPINRQEEAIKRGREVRGSQSEIRDNIRNLQKDQSLTPEERTRLIQRELEKAEGVSQEAATRFFEVGPNLQPQ